jgi:hypothetical protein
VSSTIGAIKEKANAVVETVTQATATTAGIVVGTVQALTGSGESTPAPEAAGSAVNGAEEDQTE